MDLMEHLSQQSSQGLVGVLGDNIGKVEKGLGRGWGHREVVKC